MKKSTTTDLRAWAHDCMGAWMHAILHSFKNVVLLIMIFSSLSFAQFQLPKYERYILDNGLTLYLMEQHEVPLIYASVIFPAGAVWDQDRSGLAAFTAEALLFGSKNYSKDQIEETFDFLGASINSYSGQEATEVYMSFKKDDVDKLLPIFVDVVTNPNFPQNEFDKRKKRWLAELEQDKESPRRVIRSYFNKFLFNENPYGNPLGGKNSSINELTVEELQAFFGMHYQLSSAGIVLVGDFSSAVIKSKIESYFPPSPKLDMLQLPYELTREMKTLDRNRLLLVNKDDARETTFLIGGYGVAWNNPDITQIQVINTIFGGRFTSWLNDELRVNAGITYGARSSFSNYKNAGTFFISTFTATETTIEAIDLALEVLNRLHTDGVDEETLTSAKNYLKGQFPPNYETSGDLADLLTTMHFYGLNDSYINDFEKNVDAMTIKRAKEIITKYFPKENLQFVLIGKADEIRDKIKKYGEVIEKNIEDDGF